MYEFGLVALFPELVTPVLQCGVAGRAAERGAVRLRCESPRDYAPDRHKTVDDRPFGGGPGMVMRHAPVKAALEQLVAAMPPGVPRILLSAQGRSFDHAWAEELAAGPGVILVAARYEGIDERILDGLDAELSVGDYVLSGGEPAAAIVVDAVTRLLPGVLGHAESAADDSFANGLLGYPQFTRPEDIAGNSVPEVLLSGDHERIRRWRLRQSLERTWVRRPDLLAARRLSDEEAELLDEIRAERSSPASE